MYGETGILSAPASIATQDVDFLIPNIKKPSEPIDVPKVLEQNGFVLDDTVMGGIGLTKFFKKGVLEVEFLVKEKGKGKVEPYDTMLGVTAQGLRNMEILTNTARQIRQTSSRTYPILITSSFLPDHAHPPSHKKKESSGAAQPTAACCYGLKYPPHPPSSTMKPKQRNPSGRRTRPPAREAAPAVQAQLESGHRYASAASTGQLRPPAGRRYATTRTESHVRSTRKARERPSLAREPQRPEASPSSPEADRENRRNVGAFRSAPRLMPVPASHPLCCSGTGMNHGAPLHHRRILRTSRPASGLLRRAISSRKTLSVK